MLFNVIVDTIKYEWNKLKDNYRKCMKKRARSDAGSFKLATCNFFKEMQFLYDSMQNCLAESNIPISTAENGFELVEYNESPQDTSPLDDCTPRKQSFKRKREDLPTTFPIDPAIVETLKKTVTNGLQTDSDYLFCTSLVNTMKSFSERENALARMKIQKLLFKIKHGES